MKKQIALVLTLAALAMSACDDESTIGPRPGPTPGIPKDQPDTKEEPVIYSVYPNAGAPGSTAAILGANFGPAILDNHVAFGSSVAEITYVGYGVIAIRVPNLTEGDYEIMVTARGQVRRAPQMFTINNSED